MSGNDDDEVIRPFRSRVELPDLDDAGDESEEETSRSGPTPAGPQGGPDDMAPPLHLVMDGIPDLTGEDTSEGAFVGPAPENPDAPGVKDAFGTAMSLMTAFGVAAGQGMWHRHRGRKALSDTRRAAADKAQAAAQAARKSAGGSTTSRTTKGSGSSGGGLGRRGSSGGGSRGGSGGSRGSGGSKLGRGGLGSSGRGSSGGSRSGSGAGRGAGRGGSTVGGRRSAAGGSKGPAGSGSGRRGSSGGGTRGGSSGVKGSGGPKGSKPPTSGAKGTSGTSTKAATRGPNRSGTKGPAGASTNGGSKGTGPNGATKPNGPAGGTPGGTGPADGTTPGTGAGPGPGNARRGRNRWRRARWGSRSQAGDPWNTRAGYAHGFRDDDDQWEGFASEGTYGRGGAPPGPEGMRPPPAARPYETRAEQIVPDPKPMASAERHALSAGAATASPDADPKGEPETVTTSMHQPGTQYGDDTELTIHDVCEADEDMAVQIAEGVAEAQNAVDGFDLLFKWLESMHAQVVELRVPGSLEGMLLTLMDQTQAVRSSAVAIAEGLPAAAEAIATAGSNAEARHRPLADAVADAGHTRPAERDYHAE